MDKVQSKGDGWWMQISAFSPMGRQSLASGTPLNSVCGGRGLATRRGPKKPCCCCCFVAWNSVSCVPVPGVPPWSITGRSSSWQLWMSPVFLAAESRHRGIQSGPCGQCPVQLHGSLWPHSWTLNHFWCNRIMNKIKLLCIFRFWFHESQLEVSNPSYFVSRKKKLLKYTSCVKFTFLKYTSQLFGVYSQIFPFS